MTGAWRAAEWATGDVPVAGPDIADALALARDLAPVARGLAQDPWRYLATLATLGAADLTAARAAEPHLDAVAVLAQAGDPDLGVLGVDAASSFGVYAARAPGTGLRATAGSDGPRLEGTKAWCSLATVVSHALVTADDDTAPRLYAVPLHHPGVRHETGTWVSRGLSAVTTGSMTLAGVPAVPVGGPGWYLARPGFAWGGIGVAAVWFGAAAALAGALTTAAGRRPPDQVALLHLGTTDRALHAALLSLRDAAAAIAAGRADGPAGVLLAARVRAVVADAAEEVLRVVGHGLGPAPLTQVESHARRVADLTVYLRQHHAERDLAALGGLVLGPREDR
ncbi:acyl-CoA/acyl-ACP dehydrogenase [Phycicoccus duodecadis]|uniref:Alkylation response protein AidB-like acyl-CoA dehydrogenase n=1 Tax=Phycicoccus duodecadis TaxID=173053 RepID=A0A2N3YI75_9MICO|nr:acyl-CoA/acyl-ACP dehydrogenase [Phycicoccus duodecadis]PKW26557.1 hypothetical protein ATL31_1371 [Phycicoccus duodecadis]